MATEISPELRQAIRESEGVPVEVVDSTTNQRYVLMRAEAYDRLKCIFDDGPVTVDEQRALLREAGKRAGWDDPEMDVYDDLDPRKP